MVQLQQYLNRNHNLNQNQEGQPWGHGHCPLLYSENWRHVNYINGHVHVKKNRSKKSVADEKKITG